VSFVQREDFELEELLIPEPIRLPLHRFDLVVALLLTEWVNLVVLGAESTCFPVWKRDLLSSGKWS
jgi:hypothetical protein